MGQPGYTRRNKKYMDTNENERQWPKTFGVKKKCSFMRDICNNRGLSKEGKSHIYNLTLHVKELEKEQQKKKKKPETNKKTHYTRC